MPINKLTEWGSQGNLSNQGLSEQQGFPLGVKPPRVWANFILNKITKSINEIIDFVNGVETTIAGIPNVVDQTINNRISNRPNLAPGLDTFLMSPGNSFYPISGDDWGLRMITNATGTSTLFSDFIGCRAGALYTLTADTIRFADSGTVYLDVLFFDVNRAQIADMGEAKRNDFHDFSLSDSNRNLNKITYTAPVGARFMKVRFVAENITRSGSSPVCGVRQLKLEYGDSATIYTTEAELGSKLYAKDVVNTLTETAAGKALDARQGRALNQAISDLNQNKVSNSELRTPSGFDLFATPEVLYLDTGANTYWSSGGYTTGSIVELTRIPRLRLMRISWVVWHNQPVINATREFWPNTRELHFECPVLTTRSVVSLQVQLMRPTSNSPHWGSEAGEWIITTGYGPNRIQPLNSNGESFNFTNTTYPTTGLTGPYKEFSLHLRRYTGTNNEPVTAVATLVVFY